MGEKNESTPIENLTTRAFVLTRKLLVGELTEAETVELIEIQKEMPTTSFSTEMKAFKEVQMESMKSPTEVLNERLKSQDTKYNVLLWVMGVGFSLLLAFNFFSNGG